MPLRRIDRRSLALIILAPFAFAACAAPGGRRPRPEPRPPGDAIPADPLAAPWVVHRTGMPVTQTIHVAAVIESRIDTITVVDTVQSQLTARWSPPATTGYPRRFPGAVIDYRLSRAMGDSLQVPDGVSLPIDFTAVQASREEQPSFAIPDERACGVAAAIVVQGVRDLWLSLPDTIDAEMRWADSSSHVSCRDSIPLTTTVHRDFRVTGAMVREGEVVLTIERRTRTHVEGAGLQLGDSVTISAEGSGAAMFEVSLATGTAVFASGESELRLTLQGSRRTQSLVQRSRISLLGQ